MALYIRKTKSRVTALNVKHFKIKRDLQPVFCGSNPMLTLNFLCQDNKERSITFYGEEINKLMLLIEESKNTKP